MNYPKVFAITLNWNGKEDTIECIESLKELNYPNYEMVVVDNDSADGSVSLFNRKFPGITVIENKKNLGYAKGFNTGIKYAFENNADYFLILNNDTIIDKSALKELVKISESDNEIGFVSGKVYSYDEPDRIHTAGKKDHPISLVGLDVGRGERDRGQYDEIKEYNYIDDVFLLVRREVYQKVGGYDHNFFLYCEETDWCARVRRAGFKIIYTPKAKIWHKEHLSTGGNYNPIIAYYNTRNKILFVRRNASLGRFFIYMFILAFAYSPMRIARHIKHGRFSIVVAYIRGIISGLLWLIHKDNNQC